ncbi:hypothetical protein IGI37_001156 [Enterococcus sp. AZ194]|uniref:ArsR/SmtB family transcription factor n=1 Tax=Enterococcus sp. AZ194 TaxID=2774629 RepID=UPI003F26D9C6
MDDTNLSLVHKAMADSNRIKIIRLLSKGSMCACHVLEHFEFTQPTLSHHMKVLENAGIVSMSKKSQWHYYELREEFSESYMSAMAQLFSSQK